MKHKLSNLESFDNWGGKGKSTNKKKDTKMVTEDSPWTKKKLHQDFWKGDKLDPVIRKKLLAIADEFYASTGLDAKVYDVQLTGSIANFNYHSKSDLDTHILIDFTEVNEDTDLVKRAADGKRWIWNIQHDIFLRGFEVELYIQDVNEPHEASGLYSLTNDEWLKKPSYTEPQTDPKDVEKKADDLKKEIDFLEKELNKANDEEAGELVYGRIADIKAKIVRMRREALAGGGGGKEDKVFSVENLAFKELRNSGYMGKIIDMMNQAYDKIYQEGEES